MSDARKKLAGVRLRRISAEERKSMQEQEYEVTRRYYGKRQNEQDESCEDDS